MILRGLDAESVKGDPIALEAWDLLKDGHLDNDVQALNGLVPAAEAGSVVVKLEWDQDEYELEGTRVLPLREPRTATITVTWAQTSGQAETRTAEVHGIRTG